MISKLLAVVTLLFTFYSFITAQSDKWISARLSSQPFHLDKIKSRNFSDTVVYQYNSKRQQLLQLGFGFRKVKENGWFQEFSLVNIEASVQENSNYLIIINQGIREPAGGAKVTNLGLDLRWEIGRLLGSADKQRFIPAWSVSIDPYVHFLHIIPHTSESFPSKYLDIGSAVSFIPSIKYHITKNTVFDISFPIPIVNGWFEHDKIENPTIPLKLQSQNKIDGALLPLRDTQIRLGLLYKNSH